MTSYKIDPKPKCLNLKCSGSILDWDCLNRTGDWNQELYKCPECGCNFRIGEIKGKEDNDQEFEEYIKKGNIPIFYYSHAPLDETELEFKDGELRIEHLARILERRKHTNEFNIKFI